MTPSDLAARLRMLSETVVRPVAPAHEISSDLPELLPGQRFTARIEAALPDGNFRAVVAGRNLTLSLPQAARPGDTLELVVAERTPRLVVARQTADALPQPRPATTLSRGGQLISSLLANATATTHAAPLARAAPLLGQPPAGAAALIPALQQAITRSGLFYEAHQAQWVAGRLPLEALVREPQGRHSRATQHAGGGRAGLPAVAEAEIAGKPAPTETAPKSPAVTLPPDLQPLVQQQLDTAATQQILWRGEVWPGQVLDWEIKEETQPRQEGEAEEPGQWTTRLRLGLPQLGEVSATLHLTPLGVRIELEAPGGAAEALRGGQAELSGALAAARVPLLTFAVGSHESP